MYKAPSKRRQLIQRAVIYTLMSVGVVLLVTVLVFLMLGYRFNRDTSTIQQGGLVQFNSRPGDAHVRIGRADLVDTTPSKVTVNPGDYEVRLTRDGYLPWAKNVTVLAGKVLWLNYAQLVPETIPRSTVRTFEKVAQAKASPNGRYLALLPVVSKPSVSIVTVDGARVETDEIVLEQTRATTTYKIQEWSDDSSRLLITATTGKQVRWLLVEREAKEAADIVDLTARYGASMRSIRFDPRGSDRLAVLTTENDLRLLDVSADAMSSIVVGDVETFSYYGDDHIVYVNKIDAATKSLGYVSLNDTDSPRELKRIQTTSAVKTAAAAYFSDPYLALSVGPVIEVYTLSSLPGSGSDQAVTMETLATRTLPSAPTHLSVRSGGRLVVAQYAGGFATYDIELDRQTMTSVKRLGTQELRWLDRFHPYVTDGTQLTVMEFDGANQHAIAPLSTTFDAVQTSDGKYIYSLQRTTKGTFELQRSQMILD